ncbi:MAG: IPT/TIG domain-containing protein [Puniceicoccales bacterium]|jgi:hypothetical protein|nr:IPT/TIG domain-containing protein [Puniceicoccales bacterium]
MGTRSIFSILLLGLAGCAHLDVRDVTPSTMEANAMAIYPLTLRMHIRGSEVERETVQAKAVVDGKARPMRPLSPTDYAYDYHMPAGRNAISYYFDVDYLQRVEGVSRRKTVRTPLRRVELHNRYVLGLDSSRGAPGTCVTVMGRGFSAGDAVCVGNVCAETIFVSPTSLQFVVPVLPADRSYPLTVGDETGSIPAGSFHVDAASLAVVPRILEMSVGERAMLTFATAIPTDEAGLTVEVTTDMPDAISVEDIAIPAGRSSCTATVEALEAGQGRLIFSADGFQRVVVPVLVRP